MPRILILILLIVGLSWGEIYYVSPDGSDGYSGTKNHPYQSLRRGFSAMQGGDTLYLLPGIYKGRQNTINVYDGMDKQPPSGRKGNYTLISAVPGSHVTIDGEDRERLFSLSNRSYIKFEHITWQNSGAGNVIQIHDNAGEIHHIILKNCGALNARDEKDSGIIGLSGSNLRNAGDKRLTHDILLEDCWGAGTCRIVLTIWRCENVVVRRFVGRWDDHTYVSGRPEGGTTSYESKNVSFQNCIILDSKQNPDNYGGYGSMGTAQHTDKFAIDGLEFLGNIVLNWYGSFLLENDRHTTMRNVVVKNNVIWGQKRKGRVAFSIAGGRKINVLIENNTIAAGEDFAVYASGESVLSGSLKFRSNLIYKNKGKAIIGAPNLQASYNYVYGNYAKGNSAGKHSLSVNPKLKYIVRIERQSPIAGKGYNGSDIGANILYRYGKDGTFWGDDGYNVLTSEPLWPYPNEDLIKKDFIKLDDRGFCRDSSLTNYIWNYLGNGCPPCR